MKAAGSDFRRGEEIVGDKSHVPVCCGLMLVKVWEGPMALGPGQNMHAWNTGSQAEPGVGG